MSREDKEIRELNKSITGCSVVGLIFILFLGKITFGIVLLVMAFIGFVTKMFLIGRK